MLLSHSPLLPYLAGKAQQICPHHERDWGSWNAAYYTVVFCTLTPRVHAPRLAAKIRNRCCEKRLVNISQACYMYRGLTVSSTSIGFSSKRVPSFSRLRTGDVRSRDTKRSFIPYYIIIRAVPWFSKSIDKTVKRWGKCNSKIAAKHGEEHIYLAFSENLPKISTEKEKAQSDGSANALKKDDQIPRSPDIACEMSVA